MRKNDDVNLTADFYRIFGTPDTIADSRELGWPEKLRVLGLWRTQIRSDMERGIVSDDEGKQGLVAVNAAMRRAAGRAFGPSEQVA